MKCQRCGAELLDTDTFCVKCGQKVGEPARCPVCGEILREGTKFCHKCGAAVNREDTGPYDEEIPVTPQKTIDIPFDVIEKSIIMEAEQAVVKRDFSEAEARMERERRGEIPEYPDEAEPETAGNPERQEGDEPEETQASVIRERPSRVVKAVREGRIYEKPQEDSVREEEVAGQTGGDRQKASRRRKAFSGGYGHEKDRYEDTGYEEDGYEAPDYEEDDYGDEEESSGGFDLTKATMILGIVVLIVLLIGGGVILKQKLHFNFSNIGDTTVSEPTRETDVSGEANNEKNNEEKTPGEVAGKLQIIKNVNMRNKPSTENSSILGVAKTGEVYEYYELVADSWYHIRLSDGRDAYVYKEYVEALN